jgi:hypothetical protein
MSHAGEILAHRNAARAPRRLPVARVRPGPHRQPRTDRRRAGGHLSHARAPHRAGPARRAHVRARDADARRCRPRRGTRAVLRAATDAYGRAPRLVQRLAPDGALAWPARRDAGRVPERAAGEARAARLETGCAAVGRALERRAAEYRARWRPQAHAALARRAAPQGHGQGVGQGGRPGRVRRRRPRSRMAQARDATEAPAAGGPARRNAQPRPAAQGAVRRRPGEAQRQQHRGARRVRHAERSAARRRVPRRDCKLAAAAVCGARHRAPHGRRGQARAPRQQEQHQRRVAAAGREPALAHQQQRRLFRPSRQSLHSAGAALREAEGAVVQLPQRAHQGVDCRRGAGAARVRRAPRWSSCRRARQAHVAHEPGWAGAQSITTQGRKDTP